MFKNITAIQKWAWFFAANFLFIYALNFVPMIHDADGKMFGLFKLDPIDDYGHLLMGILAAIGAWHSIKWSRIYFYFLGIAYVIDVIAFFISNYNEYSLPVNIALNFPHIAILTAAFIIAKKLNVSKK